MKLKDLYQLAVKLGIQADPRGKKEVELVLKETKKKYDKMEERDKRHFDTDSLFNPYGDSRVLAGDMNRDIKHIMVGIDMETPELLLANELNKQGKGVDMVLAHHPEGRALLKLAEVMEIQNEVMNDVGVPLNVAEKMLYPRIMEVSRGVHPANFQRAYDAANLLGLAYGCFHTITDNLVYDFFKKGLCKKKFRRLSDVMDELYKIPEYDLAALGGNPPEIVVGSKQSLTGKLVATEMTGGTNGHEDMYERLSHAGVGTVLSMHVSEKHRKEAEKYHINMIVCGHQASDSLGVNLMLDEFEKKGVKILPVGMIRVNRNKDRKKR